MKICRERVQYGNLRTENLTVENNLKNFQKNNGFEVRLRK